MKLSKPEVVDTDMDISDMDRDTVVETLCKDVKTRISYASKLAPATSRDMILIINRLQIERELAARLRKIDDGFWIPAAFTVGMLFSLIAGALLGK